MNKEQKHDNIRVAILRELYQASLNAQANELEKMERHMRQYLGSKEIDGSNEPALTVRNITFEIVESEVSPNIPYPKIEPVSYSENHDSCARVAERLCRSLRDKLDFDALNDADERYTYVYGGSVWFVEWDNDAEGLENGGVKVHCLPPDSFLPQPGVSKIEDMEYCFLRFSTTKGELIRKYGADPTKLSLAECKYEYETVSSIYDTVNLVMAFYRGADGEIGRAVFSGELLLSDIPNYYNRKGEACRLCKMPRGECSCNSGYEISDIPYDFITLKNGKKVIVPYYTPYEFPIVLRKNTLNDLNVFGISDCERIREQQQAINKIESRILSKLLKAGITPVMPEDASVSVTNSLFGQVIKLRPGETTDSYGVIDNTPDIAQDIAEADRLYDQAKRIIGITDALQGTDSIKNESGYARQIRISQASNRLESKRRLKNRAYADIYKLIFKHYLAFSDEPRNLSYKDAFGNLHFSEFSRKDFIECDGMGGWYYCDDFIFTVDQSAENTYSREALWERNLSNLESGSLGEKSSPSTLLCYWQLQEKARYPFASENVIYFKELVKRGVDTIHENKNIERKQDES